MDIRRNKKNTKAQRRNNQHKYKMKVDETKEAEKKRREGKGREGEGEGDVSHTTLQPIHMALALAIWQPVSSIG